MSHSTNEWRRAACTSGPLTPSSAFPGCVASLNRIYSLALSSVEDVATISANYDSQDGRFLLFTTIWPTLALNGEIHFGHKVSRKASFPGPRDPQGPQETFLVAGHLTRQRALEAKREGGADVISFF